MLQFAGHCKISNEDRDTLTDAILKQEVGATANGLKAIKDAKKSRNGKEVGAMMSVIIKKAKLADRGIVRWQRT